MFTQQALMEFVETDPKTFTQIKGVREYYRQLNFTYIDEDHVEVRGPERIMSNEVILHCYLMDVAYLKEVKLVSTTQYGTGKAACVYEFSPDE